MDSNKYNIVSTFGVNTVLCYMDYNANIIHHDDPTYTFINTSLVILVLHLELL